MNFSTAPFRKKGKRSWCKKNIRLGKKQLVTQFYFEAMILTCIAFVFAVIAVFALLPFLQQSC
jgi:ABC-type antimicrobial peptide transport system permease subunit